MKNSFLLYIALFGQLALNAQTRYYVDQNATGANSGQSWQNAYTDLQSALQIAQAGDEIWVAQGVYFPTAGTDQNISFEPQSGVKMYGGFAGTETDLTQRDWETNPTILSGDLGIAGDSLDNTYTILYLDNPDSLTVIDGLIFRYGYAGYPTNDQTPISRVRSGGAMYIQSDWESYAMIRNCRFEHNFARNHGGAVYVNGTGSFDTAPTFQNCIFEYNTALTDGGAVARIGNSDLERPDFVDCKFMENKAGRYGGGLYFQDAFVDSWVDVSGCTFVKNEANNEGAGAFLRIGRPNEGSRARVEKCHFEENRISAQLVFFPLSGQNTQEVYIQNCVFLKDETNAIQYDLLGADSSSMWIDGCRFEGHYSTHSIISNGDLATLQFNNDSVLNCPNAAVFQSFARDVNRFSHNQFKNINNIGNIGYPFIKNFQILNCIFENSILSRGVISSALITTPVEIKSCTFINNNINYFIWGFSSADTVTGVFQNCTFYSSNFTYDYTSAVDVIVNLEHCHFDNDSVCETYNNHNLTTICGPGNLFNLDPLFRDTANGDYSLLPCSPLLNAGSNLAAAAILTDLAGNPRIQGGTVDIGAYEAPAFALAASPAVSPACVGTEGGSISIQPVNGCEPYTYNWMPNAGTGPELNELPSGAYQLTLTDASGREITETVLVLEAPQPALSLATTHVQCGNPAGGSIIAQVSSGTGPFAYSWLPLAEDTSMLNNLAAGDYALTLTDANGCQDSATASIALMGQITLTIGGQIIPCHGETGWLSATPSTGAAPFTWQWDGWPGTDPVAEPLGPGQYSVTVTDAYGCTAANTYPPMTEPGPLSVGTGSSDQTQNNPPNGAAVVTTISGGTGPFGYLWEPGGGITQSIAGLVAGTYTVTVTDKNGCSISAEVVVEQMVSSTAATLEAGVIIYPNPATDWLRVLLPAVQSSNSWHLELSDASGRVLRSQGCQAGDCVLDLSGLASGAYVLTARSEERVFVGKVVRR